MAAYKHNNVKPYNQQNLTKKQEVALMFDNIAPRYDFLNRFLSVGIDQLWRKRLLKMLKQQGPKNILDIATGTADLAILESKICNKVVGVDISAGMLAKGQEKIESKGLTNIITLKQADSEQLPFTDSSFDAVTVAFGVRNFENLEKGLAEMYRVLTTKGKVYVLEFSKPKRFPMKNLYFFYFNNILPRWGKLVSKDSSAYSYLPESVKAFPDGEHFAAILTKCGFSEIKFTPLSNGIATIYVATKN